MNINQIDAWLEAGKGGYTTDQLKTAFDLVKNKEHWKYDIDAVIEADQVDVVSRAIPWYSGGGLMDFETLPNGKVRVRATGYWSNGMDG